MNLPAKKPKEINEIINSFSQKELAEQIDIICTDLLLYKGTIVGLDIIIENDIFPYEINGGISIKNKEEALTIIKNAKQQYKDAKNKLDILKKHVNEND